MEKNQCKKDLEEYLDNSLVNKLVVSRVPEICRKKPCILGIDEAGRGPVLGPMSYAIAYYPYEMESVLAKMKFADSKALTESTREALFESLQTRGDGFQEIGYLIKIIAPNMISNSMLRRKKYNLNALSHDTAIDLIKNVQALGVELKQVYIDTVGPPIKYKEKLQKFFPKVEFTVAEKADSKYPIVSAASVCAKVMRDRIVQNWKYIESADLHLDTFKLGSGYPADPDTKNFLKRSVDPVFGYPTLARFSWSTITKALEVDGCKCDWNEPEDEKQDQKSLTKQQLFFKSFLKKRPAGQTSGAAKASNAFVNKTNADRYFEDRQLKRVTTACF